MMGSSSRFPRMVTYGHNCCESSKVENCKSAFQFGFKSCQAYGLSDLPRMALSRGGQEILLTRKRGAGYWVWKPLIIWDNLISAKEGDILMYTDAGSKLVSSPVPLLDLAKAQDVVAFQLPFVESQYTKRDTFQLLGVEALNSTTQVLASFVLLRRSVVSLGFVSQWLTYAQDSRAVTDDPNTLGKDNFPGFVDHRHDQSVFSLLYKHWNFTAYSDPSQWGNAIKNRPYPQIIEHTRNKT
jgi:hypothetical protein